MLYAKIIYLRNNPITGTLFVCRAMIKEYHRLDVFNNRNVFSHRSRGWKSKMKVLAGFVSS